MSWIFVFHEDTSQDYEDAYEWYEKQRENLGEQFLVAVRKKIERIALNPYIFSEKSRKGYREARIDKFPYLIVYKIYKSKNVIFVSPIHHAKKFPRKKFRKML